MNIYSIKQKNKPDVVAPTCNPSTWEAEAGGLSLANCSRFLIACSLLLPRATQVLAAETGLTPSLYFMGFAATFTNKRKAYSERRIMGYSMQEMYGVESKVQDPKGHLKAQLEVGFPLVLEHYTSAVSLVKPHKVKAVCRCQALQPLRDYLAIQPWYSCLPPTCTVDFSISFEFCSLLHSQLATMVLMRLSNRIEELHHHLGSRAEEKKSTEQSCPYTLGLYHIPHLA
uniref:Uncharacterized protein n=1 Tax=Sciurus vulgaris TaxID=55149 RepID=A0A8D2DRD3_SCIVU